MIYSQYFNKQIQQKNYSYYRSYFLNIKKNYFYGVICKHNILLKNNIKNKYKNYNKFIIN